MALDAPMPPPDGPLSPEQRDALAQAGVRAREFLGAAKLATFNAWTFAICAALSILFGVFSAVGLLVGIALVVIARNEFRGRSLLRRFDPAGPRLLARNEIGVMALILAYCLWAIRSAITQPNPDYQQLEEMAGLDSGYITRFTVTAYAVVIVLTALLQGLLARYYHRRVAMVRKYLAETPAWVVELKRSAAGS